MSNEELQGYCLKCKEKRVIQNPVAEWAANGSPATRGTCPVCGGTIYLRGRTPAHDTLPKPAATATRKATTAAKSKKTPAAGKSGRTTVAGKGQKASVAGKSAKTSAAKTRKDAKSSAGGGERGGKLVVVESPA